MVNASVCFKYVKDEMRGVCYFENERPQRSKLLFIALQYYVGKQQIYVHRAGLDFKWFFYWVQNWEQLVF